MSYCLVQNMLMGVQPQMCYLKLSHIAPCMIYSSWSSHNPRGNGGSNPHIIAYFFVNHHVRVVLYVYNHQKIIQKSPLSRLEPQNHGLRCWKNPGPLSHCFTVSPFDMISSLDDFGFPSKRATYEGWISISQFGVKEHLQFCGLIFNTCTLSQSNMVCWNTAHL
jgi:hypothetical protein